MAQITSNPAAGGGEERLWEQQRLIRVAAGREPADLVLKNAEYLNVFSNELCRGDIAVVGGRIAGIGTYTGHQEMDMSGKIVLPGFLDAHIHLESSLVSPREFVRAVLPHGTTTVVTDPHEIANVMGEDGIEYMLQATEGLPVDVRFMLPSCVPASPADETGAQLDSRAIDPFYAHPRVSGLAEMMNYPGVLAADPDVLEKIQAARLRGRRIDGHAPLLMGKDLNAYVAAGISSDHECSNLEEALAKLRLGQYIMIRDGTAAKNLPALVPLLSPRYGGRCMFCCDDKHPSDLMEDGHIDHIIRRAVALGADPIQAVKAASCNAARYFGLDDRGAVAPGCRADLTVVDNLQNVKVQMVFQTGELWYDNGSLRPLPQPAVDPRLTRRAHDTFRVPALSADDFRDGPRCGVIGMVDGEIITTDQGCADHEDLSRDRLRIAVIERHKGTGHMGLGYLQGYGLQRGAVATSIAHDSHNIIVVGADCADMAAAANRVAENRGGIVVACGGEICAQVVLPLAGLMSDQPLEQVNRDLEAAKAAAYELGVHRSVDPFMTLSFMALPVIPTLRITTHGVLNVSTMQYI